MVGPTISSRTSLSENISDSRGLASTAEFLPPHERLVQLEGENFRLRRLVTELLIRNQQLRELFLNS